MTYKIIKLRRSLKRDDMWFFNLSLGGFIINGFTYLQETGNKKAAIMVPTYGVKKQRLVRAFGITWKRMLNELDKLTKQGEINCQ